jgi:hypothetical protein
VAAQVLARCVDADVGRASDHGGLVIHHRHGEGAGGSNRLAAVTTKVLVVTPTGKLEPMLGLRCVPWCAGAVVRADGGRVADRGGAGVGDHVGWLAGQVMLARAELKPVQVLVAR